MTSRVWESSQHAPPADIEKDKWLFFFSAAILLHTALPTAVLLCGGTMHHTSNLRPCLIVFDACDSQSFLILTAGRRIKWKYGYTCQKITIPSKNIQTEQN